MGNDNIMRHFIYRLRSRLSATKFQLALKPKIIILPKVITCFQSVAVLFHVVFEARTIVL